MKNILIYLPVLALALSGCRKNTEALFDKSADERITDVLNNYQTALTQDPGWKLFVYPAGLANQDIQVGGFTYYMKFAGNNRVTMLSDFSAEMAVTPKESGYNLKAIQFPSLVFDTYSYIHVLADPDPDVSSSPAEPGLGLGSDFDFALLKTEPSDTILMRGNYNKSEGLLIRTSQEEIDAAFNGRFGAVVQSTVDYTESNLLLYFTGADNTAISVSLDLRLHIITWRYFDASDELVTLTSRFSYTTDGIHLKDPITIGGYTLQDLSWNDALQVYYFGSGSNQVNLANAGTHVIPLRKIIGKSLTTLAIPTDSLPGQSPLFINNHNQAKRDIKAGDYRLDMGVMYFIFDDASKSMLLDIIVTRDGITYLAEYTYSYTINKNTGVAQFTRVNANGNATSIAVEMRPILDYIEGDHFKLDYYTGSTILLGQFTSQENPDFFFTGNLEQ